MAWTRCENVLFLILGLSLVSYFLHFDKEYWLENSVGWQGLVVGKDEERHQQHTSHQFADKLDVEQRTDRNSSDASDVTADQQNFSLIQSVADESSTELSPMTNHSAYINVSQSDDDGQQLTPDGGQCHITAFPVWHWTVK